MYGVRFPKRYEKWTKRLSENLEKTRFPGTLLIITSPLYRRTWLFKNHVNLKDSLKMSASFRRTNPFCLIASPRDVKICPLIKLTNFWDTVAHTRIQSGFSAWLGISSWLLHQNIEGYTNQVWRVLQKLQTLKATEQIIIMVVTYTPSSWDYFDHLTKN